MHWCQGTSHQFTLPKWVQKGKIRDVASMEGIRNICRRCMCREPHRCMCRSCRQVTAPLRSPVRPSSASGPARSPATTVAWQWESEGEAFYPWKKNGKCFLRICGCEFSHLVVSIFSYTSISKLISTVWSRWFWSHSQKLDQLKQVSSRILPRRRGKSSHMLESLLPRIGVQLSCQTQFANSSDVMSENALARWLVWW